MSWLAAFGVGLAALFLVALWIRRPWLVGAVAGLAGGPLLYYLLGRHLARVHGEGRFFSFPLGGYRVGDFELLASLTAWVVVIGLAGWGVARLARRNR